MRGLILIDLREVAVEVGNPTVLNIVRLLHSCRTEPINTFERDTVYKLTIVDY